MFRSCVTLLLICLISCACTSMPDRQGLPDPNLHTIYTNRFGDVAPIKHSSPDATQSPIRKCGDIADLDEKLNCEKDYAKRIVDSFVDKNKERMAAGEKPLVLTLFVHGGLNAFVNATRRSDRFSEDMLKEGTYPVFLAWDSGGPTNYLDHLIRVRKGESRPVLGALTSPVVLVEDGLRSIAHAPAAIYKTLVDPLVVVKSLKFSEEEDYETRGKVLGLAGFQVINPAPYTGVGSSYWSVLNPIKVITAPLIDGFGTGAWRSMLRRTDLILSKTSAYEGARVLGKEDIYSKTAATLLLQEWEGRPELSKVEIHLIGHSMGSIVANNIIARHPNLNITRLVYMAGAARIKDVEDTVVPWMRLPKHAAARFYNLSIDPYREIGENAFYDFLPRGSLLNWIDNIFGEVNSFKDRTVGSWWNIVRTAEDVFPSDMRHRIYLVRFPIGGEEKGPQAHGEFDEYCFWQSSFWTVSKPLERHPDCAATRSK